MKHLLKLLDLTGEEILEILNLADQLKYETKHGIEHPHLKGKALGMIFEKSSTRTRVSFEVGINQLGGYAVVLAGEGSQIGRGEPVQDTARVLSRYLGRHHDPHLRPEGGRGSRAVRLGARHQRPHGFLPPLPDSRRPDDDPRV